jgi:hypothetical protein
MRRVLLAGVLAALVGAGLVSAAASRTSFADGTWRGSAKLTQSSQGVALTATSSFTMRVRAGRVSGTLLSRGAASGAYGGSPITAAMSSRATFSGSAAKPAARGSLTITATVDGKPQSGAAPVIYTFTGLRGTCSRMVGRIVLGSTKPQPAGQGPSTVSAPFVATRTSGPAC